MEQIHKRRKIPQKFRELKVFGKGQEKYLDHGQFPGRTSGTKEGSIARVMTVGFAIVLRVLAGVQGLLAVGAFQAEVVPILAQ